MKRIRLGGGSLFIAIFLAFSAFALSASEAPVDSRPVQRVVVLYSEPLDFPATELTERAIREVFLGNPTHHIQLFSEYLDLSRFRDLRQREALADLLLRRYGEGGVALIIGVDVPAVGFLLENGERIFPNTPVVLCSIPEALLEQLETSPLRARMTGVLEPNE